MMKIYTEGVSLMATMNISLPEPMRNWVQDQIEGGKYASSSDYVRDLIRKDQEQRDKFAMLQAAITEGLESGEPTPLDMNDIIKKAQKAAGIDV